MGLPPGLLPEDGEVPRSRFPLGAVLATLVGVSLAGYAYLQVRQARTDAEARGREIDVVQEESRQLRDQVSRLQAELAQPPPPPPPLPVPAPEERRYLPATGPEAVQERVTQGLQDLRAGRPAEAERQFFRALPDGLLYLSLACLAQGEVAEAYAYFAKAMAHVPGWLRKVKPRDLFGSEEAYRGIVTELERRVQSDPLDVKSKLLLAYFRFHDQGDGFAKALVVEVQQVQPDSEDAGRFMEALGP
jgi:cytochrome c-type biogenesis protein CcmH/NrfG